MSVRQFLLTTSALALLGVPAFADVFTFDASGSIGGSSVAGSAAFNVNTLAKTVTVTLTNALTSTISDITQSLAGVVWTWDRGNIPGTLTLDTTASAAGALDCTASTNSVSNCSPVAPSILGTDFGWGLNATQGPGGVPVGTPNLFAGNGSGHPGGIVTSNINGSLDGLRNGQHNPYLIGPVSFTLHFTGNITSVDSASLYFGTAGDRLNASCTTCGGGGGGAVVPEPASILLFGTMLLGSTALYRRRKRTA